MIDDELDRNVNDIKVTICVPMYNSEKYIVRCIDSLCNQTLHEIEIIIVDDCSTDNSLKIINNYSKKDPRIKILQHKINLGLMETRRTGYMNALGKYIAFCDSDDTLPPNAIEILYRHATETNFDIISGNICHIKVNGNTEIISAELIQETEHVNIFKRLLTGKLKHNLAGKLFSKSLFVNKNYKTFRNHNYAEDLILFYQIVELCNGIKHIGINTYFYWQNKNSITQSRLNSNSIKQILLANKVKKDICLKYPELENDLFLCISKILLDLFRRTDDDNCLETLIKQFQLSEYIDKLNIIKHYGYFRGIILIFRKYSSVSSIFNACQRLK